MGAGSFTDSAIKALPQAAADTQAVADALAAQQKSGLYSSVTVQTINGRQATAAAIRSGIARLRAAVRPGDVAVVYIYGYQATDSDARARLLTADTDSNTLEHSTLLLSELRQALAALPSNALILMDLNHGTPVADIPLTARGLVRGNPPLRARVYDPGLDPSGLPPTVRLFFAATGRETARNPLPGHPSGAFAAALVEGLSGKAADSASAPITADALCRYVTARVPVLTGGHQHPRLPWTSTPAPDFPLAIAAPASVTPVTGRDGSASRPSDLHAR